jgi:hypothetical protein
MRVVSLVMLGLLVAGAAHAQSTDPGNAHAGPSGGGSQSTPSIGNADPVKARAQTQALAKLKDMQLQLQKFRSLGGLTPDMASLLSKIEQQMVLLQQQTSAAPLSGTQGTNPKIQAGYVGGTGPAIVTSNQTNESLRALQNAIIQSNTTSADLKAKMNQQVLALMQNLLAFQQSMQTVYQ